MNRHAAHRAIVGTLTAYIRETSGLSLDDEVIYAVVSERIERIASDAMREADNHEPGFPVYAEMGNNRVQVGHAYPTGLVSRGSGDALAVSTQYRIELLKGDE